MKEIFDRKKELIKRDPLYKELLKRVSCKNFNILKKTLEEIEDFWKPYPSMPAQELQIEVCKRELAIQAHQKKYPDQWEFFRLINEVSYKWHVLLELNQPHFSIKPYTKDEVIWIGKPLFDEYTSRSASIHYPQLKWMPYPNPFKKTILADINSFITPGFLLSGYEDNPDRWLPIIINTARLNKSDAKRIKRLLWEIIEARLQKGADKKPYYEYPECAFLYRLRREDTFQKYLKWYDIHTQEKLGFRILALYENSKSKEEFFEKAIGNKIKWGNPVKGEDKIEKGIKLIYKAIHRIDYSQKNIKPVIEEYTCSTHQGNKCPASCKYFKDWMGRFNRLMPS